MNERSASHLSGATRAPSADEQRFAITADRFGISPEHWGNPSAKMFIETFNRLETLQEDLVGPHHLDVPGMDPSLSMRFACVDNLLRAAMEMLADGLEGQSRRPAERGYLKDKVGLALEPYGLRVVEQPEPDDSQR